MRALQERTVELCETQGIEAVADYCIQANPNLRSHAEAGPDALDGLRRMFLALNSTGYANTIRAMPEENFPTERLSEITPLTLVLVEEEDPAREATRLTHTRIPGSQYVVIPGAARLSNLDRPEEVNNHILDFLQRIEADVRISGRL